MAQTPAETAPTPADGQQMNRSNDPAVTRVMDAAAPAEAMASRRQRLTGSAAEVGSVGFKEAGVFDIDPVDHPTVDFSPPMPAPDAPRRAEP